MCLFKKKNKDTNTDINLNDKDLEKISGGATSILTSNDSSSKNSKKPKIHKSQISRPYHKIDNDKQ